MQCDLCQADDVDQLIPIGLCRSCNYAVCMKCYYFAANQGCSECNESLELLYICSTCSNKLPNRNICKKCANEFHP